MEFFFNIKNFKSHEKVIESFSALINWKVGRKWRGPFFSIINFKSHKAVMEFLLRCRSFMSRKNVTEFFFSGNASLSFHMMHKFPGTIFSLSVPNEFLWLNISFLDYTSLWPYILISMKKDRQHISVNTVRATLLLHKWMALHT